MAERRRASLAFSGRQAHEGGCKMNHGCAGISRDRQPGTCAHRMRSLSPQLPRLIGWTHRTLPAEILLFGRHTSNIAIADKERRSLSPARATRRTTIKAVIECRQWCVAVVRPLLFKLTMSSLRIRCDSTRPHCANYGATPRAEMCEEDPAPTRRGPDKKPGMRQRRCEARTDQNVRLCKLSSLKPDSSSRPSPTRRRPSDERSTKRWNVAKREAGTQSLGDLTERVRDPGRTIRLETHSRGRGAAGFRLVYGVTSQRTRNCLTRADAHAVKFGNKGDLCEQDESGCPERDTCRHGVVQPW
ncbi:hypothetical protein B0H17DRAFT_1182206 [Mycena rosella]|uniref:Uncharacterized protein n=1 Tax=Mycena rosella TaxID=1033263 RepID=A0AAD7GD30_MYCRO|nr:hypothetical protein B0H17DRAFT_1182206 [Mycena rosella]